jgi:transcriptional regulator with XRE-family HTH domain
LAARRVELGYTQNTLARAMDDVVSAQAIAKWESGSMPGGNFLLPYAKALRLKPQEVVAMVERAREQRAVAR